MHEEETAPERPAASAKGTVKPSESPMMMSRTISEDSKCFSIWDGSRLPSGEGAGEMTGPCAESGMPVV
jgi:hypothetical protein